MKTLVQGFVNICFRLWIGVVNALEYNCYFSYSSLGSQGKNAEVVCHLLLQWTTFCQKSPP